MHVIESTVHAGERGLTGRPAPQLPDAANVYVAGDWVGAEGWLSDAALASAKQAAVLIIARPASVRDRTPAAVA